MAWLGRGTNWTLRGKLNVVVFVGVLIVQGDEVDVDVEVVRHVVVVVFVVVLVVYVVHVVAVHVVVHMVALFVVAVFCSRFSCTSSSCWSMGMIKNLSSRGCVRWKPWRCLRRCFQAHFP